MTIKDTNTAPQDAPPVHILHVIGSMSPADGGPPEAVRQLARAHALIGDTMEVVCQDNPAAPWLANMPCPTHALGRGSLGRFGLSPRLGRWLRGNAPRFDGIVMNGLWIYANAAVRSAALRVRVPYAVFPHGGLDPWFNQKYPLKHLKKLLYWPIQYPVLRDAAAVFFTTDIERNLAVTSFRPNRWNGLAVSFGLNEPEGDPSTQAETFYSRLPQLRDHPFLLYMSRIHEKKGCDLLLEAFTRVFLHAPDLHLVIAGPDQVGLRAKLQRLAADKHIAERVHWPGMLSGDFKWGALRACQAFVLPSHQENFGIVVVEALAAGRPVLISNQVNIWPEIQADGAGLVDEDTIDGTERLLRRWLSMSEEEQAAMAAQAHPTFARRFSMEGVVRATNRVFRDRRRDGAKP